MRRRFRRNGRTRSIHGFNGHNSDSVQRVTFFSLLPCSSHLVVQRLEVHPRRKAPLPCGLGSSTKDSGRDPSRQSPSSVWAPGKYTALTLNMIHNYIQYPISHFSSYYSAEVLAARNTSRNTITSPHILPNPVSSPTFSILGPPPLPYHKKYDQFSIFKPHCVTDSNSIHISTPQSTSDHKMPPKNRILDPHNSFHLGAFNVRSLMQIGQQAALAETLSSLNIDVCCLSETRIQDSSTVLTLRPLKSHSRKNYQLRLSGDSTAAATGQAGVGIALSSVAEAALLDWFPVNSRLCAVRLQGSLKVSSSGTNRSLFVVAAYAPTNGYSDATKDEFYQQLSILLRKACRTDIIILAGDMNAQVGRLDVNESCLGGRHSVSDNRNDNGERLLHLCADHRLFLSSTNFRGNIRRRVTWRPPSSNQLWTQIDHIAISSRWRGCIQDCRSFWSTHLDSDHALVRAKVAVRFGGRPKNFTKRIDILKLANPSTAQRYESTLKSLLSSTTPEDVQDLWSHISKALLSSSTEVCGTANKHNSTQWISTRSTELFEHRRCIPAGSEHNLPRKKLRKELKKSLKNDRENWWSHRASEMEIASASGNFRRLFQLIRETGARPVNVSETIHEQNGEPITTMDRRIERWVEYFEEQFNWPSLPTSPDYSPTFTPWAVNLMPPSVTEVTDAIAALKRHKAPGPDNLHPVLFKYGGHALCNYLTLLLQRIWNQEKLPDDWGSATIVPIFKRGGRSQCSNYRGISLISIASKLLAAILLQRLSPYREQNIREEQAGFRTGRGCIDHLYTLRQMLEDRHTYRQPTILIFLDIKGAFDSINRVALWQCLIRNGIPEKYVNIIQALYAHTSGQIRVYGQLSRGFPIASGVRQGCPLSPFLFNFAIDEILQVGLDNASYGGVELIPGNRLRDLEYADDVVLACNTTHDAQNTLSSLATSVQHFGMQFSPSKCKVMLFDWQEPAPLLTLGIDTLEIVEKFTYLGSCFSHNGVNDEVTNRITKARGAFVKLHYLWRRKDLSVQLKGRVYNASVRAILLYGSETWPSRIEDIRRLMVFDHRCLRSIAHIWWEHRVSNDQVRRRVFGTGKLSRPISKVIEQNKLRWLGHILRMPTHRLPRRALCATPGAGWRKPPGGQKISWRRSMKALTARLASVGSSRLQGWGPKDEDNAWLTTLADMAQNRIQWRTCCEFLT